MPLSIRVAFYKRTNGPGTLEVAYHDPRARDRIVDETSAWNATFKLAMTVPLTELVARGIVGPKTAAHWEQRCALRGAVRAYGIA